MPFVMSQRAKWKTCKFHNVVNENLFVFRLIVLITDERERRMTV